MSSRCYFHSTDEGNEEVENLLGYLESSVAGTFPRFHTMLASPHLPQIHPLFPLRILGG